MNFIFTPTGSISTHIVNGMIRVTKADTDGHHAVDLTEAEARLVLSAMPTEPRTAWIVAGSGSDLVTIHPADVHEFAEALLVTLDNLG